MFSPFKISRQFIALGWNIASLIYIGFFFPFHSFFFYLLFHLLIYLYIIAECDLLFGKVQFRYALEKINKCVCVCMLFFHFIFHSNIFLSYYLYLVICLFLVSLILDGLYWRKNADKSDNGSKNAHQMSF